MTNTSRSPAGMIQLQARGSVDDAWERLEGAVTGRNLTVFARIDFAADAAAVGMTLLPTRLLVFGSPPSGDPGHCRVTDRGCRPSAPGAGLGSQGRHNGRRLQ